MEDLPSPDYRVSRFCFRTKKPKMKWIVDEPFFPDDSQGEKKLIRPGNTTDCGSVTQSNPTPCSRNESRKFHDFVASGLRPVRKEFRLGAQSACWTYALVKDTDLLDPPPTVSRKKPKRSSFNQTAKWWNRALVVAPRLPALVSSNLPCLGS